MNKVIHYDKADFVDMVSVTSREMGLREAVVEKDFWVCAVLDYLFHRCPWKDAFTFKGGTSLSKVYGLIKRFSEDIDIILDWRVVGYGMEEPWQDRSKSKQDKFNKEANAKTEIFLRDKLLPRITNDLKSEIGDDIECLIREDDPQTIIIRYPRLYSEAAILPEIRLEIGALAAWSPARESRITPYLAEYLPEQFEQPSTVIRTVLPERSFWEKATILHHEANRPPDSKMPTRYARHYYDVYCIGHSDYKSLAFCQLDLLERVVNFKKKFYPRGWARYEDAKPGTIKLTPPDYRMSEVEKDYLNMRQMFFGDFPAFRELMEYIQELESEINMISR